MNLFVMPHLDDETFSCGAFLRRESLYQKKYSFSYWKSRWEGFKNGAFLAHIEKNPKNLVIVFCKGRNRKNTSQRVDAFVNIMQSIGTSFIIFNYKDLELEKVLTSKLVDKILTISKKYCLFDNTFGICTVSENDLHQDHRKVSHVAKIAARALMRLKRVRVVEFRSPFENFDKTNYLLSRTSNNDLIIKHRWVKMYKTENQPTDLHEYFREIYRGY